MIHYHLLEHGGRGNIPQRIIVHSMAEHILDPVPIHAPAFLEMYGLSAHVLVSPNGDLIRCRYDEQIAWHARGHNTNTLGIEFLVEGSYDYAGFIKRIKKPYVTIEQWISGVNQVATWCAAFSIPFDQIQRHSDISPGRKVDPGKGFDWDAFVGDVRIKRQQMSQSGPMRQS